MRETITFSNLLVPLIILTGTSLIFLVLLLIAIVQWLKVAAARRWPVARGTVIESRVAESRDSQGAHFYRPLITYQYLAGGHLHTSQNLAFGSKALTEGGAAARQRALETVNRYAPGQQIEVHYHPRQPDRSVLEIRSALAKGLVIAGLIFQFAGVLVAAVVLIVNMAG